MYSRPFQAVLVVLVLSVVSAQGELGYRTGLPLVGRPLQACCNITGSTYSHSNPQLATTQGWLLSCGRRFQVHGQKEHPERGHQLQPEGLPRQRPQVLQAVPGHWWPGRRLRSKPRVRRELGRVTVLQCEARERCWLAQHWHPHRWRLTGWHVVTVDQQLTHCAVCAVCQPGAHCSQVQEL